MLRSTASKGLVVFLKTPYLLHLPTLALYFPPMSCRLILLSVASSLLLLTQCAGTDKEKSMPDSQRAVRLERADPLVLDTTAASVATASAAVGGTEPAYSTANYRVTVRATDASGTSAPADIRNLLGRAKAKSHLKEYTAAISYLNMAVRFAPTNAEAYYQRGLTRLKMKQYPAAIADFNKATVYNPQYKEAYFGRGAARIQTLNFRSAVPDFTTAISIDSTYADAYEYRGISYASLNKPAEAKADLEKAVQLNPQAAKSFSRYVEK